MRDQHPGSTIPLTKLRLSGMQYKQLQAHLFPGDGRESVAVALCGMTHCCIDGEIRRVLTVYRIYPVPDDQCSVRTPNRITWSTEQLSSFLVDAARRKQVLLKIHSHPTGWPNFSECDDQADRELFAGAAGWLDTDNPGASAVMLPDGLMFGRSVSSNGLFRSLSSIAVAGDDIKIWRQQRDDLDIPEFARRNAQLFGTGTTQLLSQLSVAVVGCSGTGSPTIEMLARLGVGELVLVDPQRVEEKNLNRIYNTTMEDAQEGRYKVDAIGESIEKIGLGTRVVSLVKSIFDPEAVQRVAQCDVVFGCMDSVDGRDLVNRLCTAYLIPYFDVGIRIDADGKGGVNQVCGSVHYLQPGGSSLLSRGVYTLDELAAASLFHANPDGYREQLKVGYIRGVNEDRPAVIPINTSFASMAVIEFLARLHPFRDDPNCDYASTQVSWTQMRCISESDSKPCEVLAKYTGRGDIEPLLDMPALSRLIT